MTRRRHGTGDLGGDSYSPEPTLYPPDPPFKFTKGDGHFTVTIGTREILVSPTSIVLTDHVTGQVTTIASEEIRVKGVNWTAFLRTTTVAPGYLAIPGFGFGEAIDADPEIFIYKINNNIWGLHRDIVVEGDILGKLDSGVATTGLGNFGPSKPGLGAGRGFPAWLVWLDPNWYCNQNIEYVAGKGPVILSPDGNRHRLVVDNAGAVSSVPA